MSVRPRLRILFVACALGAALWGILRSDARVRGERLGAPEIEPAAAALPRAGGEQAPVTTVAQDDGSARRPVVEQPSARADRAIPVEPRTEAPVPMRLLTGSFVHSDSTPATGAALIIEVRAPAARGSYMEVTTDSAGRFFSKFPDPCREVVLTCTAGEHARFHGWFELPSSGTCDLGTLVLSAGGRITGNVRLAADASTSGWVVAVLPREPTLPSTVSRGTSGQSRLDPEGRFLLENVPAGPCELSLVHPLLGEVAAQELEVRAGATTSHDFSFAYGSPDALLIVDLTGVPMTLTAPQLWLRDARGSRIEPAMVQGARAIFSGLAADGRYELTLEPEGGKPSMREGLTAGEHCKVEVDSAGIRPLDALTRDAVRTWARGLQQPPR